MRSTRSLPVRERLPRILERAFYRWEAKGQPLLDDEPPQADAALLASANRALCEQVEGLREEIDRRGTDFARLTRERDEARAEVERLRNERISLAGTDLGERALVVRWLRRTAEHPNDPTDNAHLLADAIERGEHLDAAPELPEVVDG
jgi:hypothetical protein